MRYTFLIAIIMLLFTGCNKDKFTTAPQLKYKSVNHSVLNTGEDLIFTFSFTDDEGDINNSLFIQQVSSTCPGGALEDGTSYKVADIPGANLREGEIKVSFSYGYLGNYPQLSPTENCTVDTCYFRFVLKDKADHISDTVNSETIVLLNQ